MVTLRRYACCSPAGKTIVQADLGCLKLLLGLGVHGKIVCLYFVIQASRVHSDFSLQRVMRLELELHTAGLTDAAPSSGCLTTLFVCSTGLIHACAGVMKSLRSVNVCRISE